MEYFLSIQGKVSERMSLFRVTELVRAGEVSNEALIWTKGQDGWKPIKEVETFAFLFQIPKGPDMGVDFQDSSSVLTSPRAADRVEEIALPAPSALIRFWARLMDYAWYIVLTGFLIGVTLPTKAVMEFLQQSSGMSILINALAVLLFAPLEAWMLMKFGTTPGKAMLGVRVCSKRPDDLSFQQALFRSITVAIRGVGLWIPFFSLFTMLFSRIRLMQTHTTVWDEQAATFLVQKPIPSSRMAIMTLVSILMLVLMIYSSFAAQQMLDQ